MACSWPSGGLSCDQRNPTWATDYRRCDGVHCCRGLLLGDAACLRADVGTGHVVVGVGNSCPGCADGSDAAGTVTVLVVRGGCGRCCGDGQPDRPDRGIMRVIVVKLIMGCSGSGVL